MADPQRTQASMLAQLAERTGRTLAEWTDLALGSGRDRHGELVRWLRTEHGLPLGFANLIALESLHRAATAATGGDVLVDRCYPADKAALRPIHDAIVAIAGKLGGDVEVLPRRTHTALRRRRVFAIVQPAAARVDLGLRLPGAEPEGRLEPAGRFHPGLTHRVRLAAESDVDADVKRWLQRACDAP